MTQTPGRKYRASLAAQNALRIRFANNTPRLDLAIKAAEAEATVVRTVPLLFQQPFPQGSRVFSYEDQTYLLLRMEPDGSYYPMVPDDQRGPVPSPDDCRPENAGRDRSPGVYLQRITHTGRVD